MSTPGPSRLQSLGSKLQQVDPGAAKRSASGGVGAVKDAARLTVDYVKQETVDPLRSLGRQLAFGLAAAIAIGHGLVLLLLGALRGVQTLFGANDATGRPMSEQNTYIPYFIVALACLLALTVLLLAFRSATRAPGSRDDDRRP
jgi:hypothetical protein